MRYVPFTDSGMPPPPLRGGFLHVPQSGKTTIVPMGFVGSKSGEEVYYHVGPMFSLHPSVNTIPFFITRPYSMSGPLENGIVFDNSVHRNGQLVQRLVDKAKSELGFCSVSLGSSLVCGWRLYSLDGA